LGVSYDGNYACAQFVKAPIVPKIHTFMGSARASATRHDDSRTRWSMLPESGECAILNRLHPAQSNRMASLRRDAGIAMGSVVSQPPNPAKPELSFWSSHFGCRLHRRPVATSLFRLSRAVTSFPSRETMQFGLQSALSGMLHWCPRGECRIVRQAVTLIHLEKVVRLSRKRSERARMSSRLILSYRA
jgi:hypothetical protein